MQNERRNFFKTAMVIAAGSLLLNPLSAAVAAEERRRAAPGAAGGDDLPLVEPGKGMAASMNYVHKKSDIKDAKMKTERQGVPFDKQSCAGCMLYTKHGMKNGEEVGKCTLFQGQVVKGAGWCNSWAKKA